MPASKRGGERRAVPRWGLLLGALLCASLPGCNVQSTARSTGGVSLDGGGPRPDGGAGGSRGERIRGIAVSSTDYLKSVVISLLSPAGEVESAAFIGSGSAAPGLSAALSGDVVFPTSRIPGDELVLVDRYLTSVLTWVNLETSEVRAQLSVATGFNSNPHDYVPYTSTEAFVTRFEPNLDAGRRPFDAGNDVLVIDPSVPEITGSIDLTPVMAGEPPGYYPRADRALLVGGKLRVLASGYDLKFTDAVDSRVVTIDPDTHEVLQVLVLRGMRGCWDLRPSPDGAQLAVACPGLSLQDPSSGYPDSGVVLLAVGDGLTEAKRYTARDWGTEQVSGVAWTSSEALLVTFFGREAEVLTPGAVRFLDVARDSLDERPIVQGRAQAWTIGNALCAPADRVCFVPDAEPWGGRIHQLSIGEGGRVTESRAFTIDTGTGLPPRYLERY